MAPATVELEVECIAKSPNAICVLVDDREGDRVECWIPNSVFEVPFGYAEPEIATTTTILVQQWFAAQKELA